MDKMEDVDFSGVAYLQRKETWTTARGFANRADERPNAVDTRFGIASGSKLFTAVAVCQLVEAGKLDFNDKLSELLPQDFSHVDVTIHQLLTHTSGIPDYFDEQVMDDFEELWKKQPMYLMETASDFIPLFKDQPMMFQPGERFRYNNAGFIALGLVIEQVTGKEFAEVIEQQIFTPAKMQSSGYFRLDRLPRQTALGYIEEDGMWRTNQYAIPIRGGADGGAYVTANDMANFWNCLMEGVLVTKEMLQTMLQVHASGKDGDYGYGLWIQCRGDGVLKYHVTGYDPGVSFHSAFYPADSSILTVLSNKDTGTYEINGTIEEMRMEKE
ncbi:hypothetical protein BBH88_00795 [Planococcus antarcticus DSM 14505]|nr:hypothetical protein BBH88_00795 [Planococcus antarcticus DSM 14505]